MSADANLGRFVIAAPGFSKLYQPCANLGSGTSTLVKAHSIHTAKTHCGTRNREAATANLVVWSRYRK
jgi:hypothetical protein